MNERIKELFNDVSEFDLISSLEFFKMSDLYIEQGLFDAFENTVTILVDTGNIDGLIELFSLV